MPVQEPLVSFKPREWIRWDGTNHLKVDNEKVFWSNKGLEDMPVSFGVCGTKKDVVNHPTHYTSHPSGIECIQITEHMGFNLGNALKYIWRADLKGKSEEDLKKAIWYIERELAKRKR